MGVKMKKNLIWVSVSVSLLASLSVAQETINCDDGSLTSAAQVQVNADGSAHVFGKSGKSIYLNPRILKMMKNVNPGTAAAFKGSTPCVGNSAVDRFKVNGEM